MAINVLAYLAGKSTLFNTFIAQQLQNNQSTDLESVQQTLLGGGSQPPVVDPVFNPVTVAGNTPAAGTAAKDAFNFNAVAALADVAGTNTQTTITGFDKANDKLVLDLPIANPAITTLAALAGQQGITVLDNPFNGSASINFGNDANGGEVVSLDLVGITPADWASVVVQVV